MMNVKLASFFLTLSLAAFSNIVHARDNASCGIIPGQPLTNSYGPFDFRDSRHAKNVELVVKAHFNSRVANLIGSKKGKGTPHGDIDYTLRALPNHHRALYSASALERRDTQIHKRDSILLRTDMYTVECYFKRAFYFQPNDPIPYMLYAMHLQKLLKFDEAEENYKKALKLDPENAEIQYNAGLLYLELGDLNKAKEHADRAYAKGFPLKGLRNKINRLTTQKNSMDVEK